MKLLCNAFMLIKPINIKFVVGGLTCMLDRPKGGVSDGVGSEELFQFDFVP